jgi:CheY-like chemotaxis protein
MEHSTVSPISILVVDDEKLIRWSLRERLEQAGYRVVVAGSAEQTLENLNDRVSLALLDVKLPDMGGIELCHEIARLIRALGAVGFTSTDPHRPWQLTPSVARLALVWRDRLSAVGVSRSGTVRSTQRPWHNRCSCIGQVVPPGHAGGLRRTRPIWKGGA